MPLKSNYHGLKSVDTSRSNQFDGLATEIVLFIVTGIMAYMGYVSGFLLLFFVSFIASIIFLMAILVTIYTVVKSNRQAKREDISKDG